MKGGIRFAALSQSGSLKVQPLWGTEVPTRHWGFFMRTIALVALVATLAVPLPALAEESTMVTLKANQIGQIFCLSRIGNDEAVIEGLLTADLRKAIDEANKKEAAYEAKYPGEKPPLGDGIPWQSAPDYAAKCETGLVTLSKTDAKVELNYAFPDDPAANFTDTLILKKIEQPDYGVGFWRIDNVVYPDGTDLKGVLVSAFEGLN